MLRIRDHIISLVAVFLALGLGILIGTGLTDDMVVTQQRLLIERMTDDYRDLRDERKVLEADLRTLSGELYLWQRYREALYPGMFYGLLAGKNVAVVAHGAEIPDGVLNVLGDGQAEISSIIRIHNDAGAETAGLGSVLMALILGDITAEHKSKAADLAGAGTLEIQELSGGRPDYALFIVGEKDSMHVPLVHDFMAAADAALLTVVGLEWSQVADSLLKEFKAAGYSTIDNADTVFGQHSLLSVLRGARGSFGSKATADQFIATF